MAIVKEYRIGEAWTEALLESNEEPEKSSNSDLL